MENEVVMEGGGRPRKRRRESDPESKRHRHAADTLQEVEEEGGRGREEYGLNNAFPMVIRKKNMLDSGEDEISSSYQEEEDGGGERREAGNQEDDTASEATGREVDKEHSSVTSQEISKKKKGAEEEGVVPTEGEEDEDDGWYEIDGSSVPSSDSLTKGKRKKKYFGAFWGKRRKAEGVRTNRKGRHQTDNDCKFSYSAVLRDQRPVFFRYNTIMIEVKKHGEGIFVCISPPPGKSFSETDYVSVRVELIHSKGDYSPYEVLPEGERERGMEGEGGREGERGRRKQREVQGYYRSEVVPKDILETFKCKDMICVRVYRPQFHS